MSLAEFKATYPTVALVPADPDGVQQWFEIVEGEADVVGLRGLLSWDGVMVNLEVDAPSGPGRRVDLDDTARVR